MSALAREGFRGVTWPSLRIPRASIAPVACSWPVCGGARLGLAPRRGGGGKRGGRPGDARFGLVDVAARASASSSASPDEGGGAPPDDPSPVVAATTAVEQQQQQPSQERRASRSRQAELLDRELAAVRAMGLDAARLRAALAALGDDDGKEDEEEEQEEDEGRAGASSLTSSPSTAALQRRLAARRLRERARVVRLPLRYASSGRRAASRRYPVVPVDVDGVGFTDFLLDAGVYGAAITPALRERLGLAPTDGAAVTALASGGATVRQRVRLPDLWIGTAKLPPLQATVGPLPSAALPGASASSAPAAPPLADAAPPATRPLSPSAAARAPAAAAAAGGMMIGGGGGGGSALADPPGGLLGVKALRQFDIDFDARVGALGLHPAGHAAAGLLDVSALRAVACRFTRAGLVCLPVALGPYDPCSSSSGAPPPPLPPPAVLGILDLSATVSVLNWQAAALLGMRCEAALRERQEEEEEDEAEAAMEGEGGQKKSKEGGQKPLDYRGHYGQIVFTDPAAPALLERPAPPPEAQRPAPPPPSPPPRRRRAAAPGGVRSTRLELQEHRCTARLVLGDPRVGGGRVELRPPARVAVAHLKGLAQLGLGEQPAMLVGSDVWAARGARAVLCLKEGLLYLE